MRALPLLCLLVACYPTGPALDGDADPAACDETFDDHTTPLAPDVASTAKINITSLMDPEHRTVRVLDDDFYDLHDEWYWFRLLNGQSACGATTDPVDVGREFDSIDEVYAWAASEETLPLDLRFAADGRLYSPSFYTLSLRTDPRVFGPGTLKKSGERFTFELALVDEANEQERAAMRDALSAAVGAPVTISGDPECACVTTRRAGYGAGLAALAILILSTRRRRTSSSSRSAG